MSQPYEALKYRLGDPFGGGNRTPRGEGRGPSGDLHPALGLLLAVGISIIFWTGLVTVALWALN